MRLARTLTVDVEGVGRIGCDSAFGGAFHAYVDADRSPTGTAFLTGRHEFLINPGDPLRDGFILR